MTLSIHNITRDRGIYVHDISNSSKTVTEHLCGRFVRCFIMHTIILKNLKKFNLFLEISENIYKIGSNIVRYVQKIMV